MDELTLTVHLAILAFVGGLHSRSRMFFDVLGIEYMDCRLRLLSCVNSMTRIKYGKGVKVHFSLC